MISTHINTKAFLLLQEALKRNYQISMISEKDALYTLDIHGKTVHFRNSDCSFLRLLVVTKKLLY
jgi:hypothetical protein